MTDTANEALLASWELSLHQHQPRTVALYLQEARRFAAWLDGRDGAHGAHGDLLAVTKRDVEAWLGDLRARGLAQATMRSRWIALRNLYGWAAKEGEIDASPLERVTVSKGNEPAPDVLDATTLVLLLKSLAGTDFYSRRDLALFRLMLATGLRVSEACGLTPGDVDLRNRVVTVAHGKGDKARIARFDPATAAALDRYLRIRARHGRHAASPALWIGFRGPLTRKGVATILNGRARRAGLGHIHPHQLRHTWASRWLAAGGQEGDLQRLGGWENAEVMRRYGSARAVDRALSAYDQVNPMEGL